MKFARISALVLAFVFAFSLAAKENKKTKEDYIRDLNSGDVYLQQEACRYIGEKKDISSVDSLIFLLEEKNADLHVRIAAANALVSIGEEGAADALLQTMQESSEPALQYTILLGLLHLGRTKQAEEINAAVIEMESSSDPFLSDLAKRIRAKYTSRKAGTK